MSTYAAGLTYLIARGSPAIFTASPSNTLQMVRDCATALFTQQHFVAITSILRQNLLLTHFGKKKKEKKRIENVLNMT